MVKRRLIVLLPLLLELAPRSIPTQVIRTNCVADMRVELVGRISSKFVMSRLPSLPQCDCRQIKKYFIIIIFNF